jgi:hypothetical protein
MRLPVLSEKGGHEMLIDATNRFSLRRSLAGQSDNSDLFVTEIDHETLATMVDFLGPTRRHDLEERHQIVHEMLVNNCHLMFCDFDEGKFLGFFRPCIFQALIQEICHEPEKLHEFLSLLGQTGPY